MNWNSVGSGRTSQVMLPSRDARAVALNRLERIAMRRGEESPPIILIFSSILTLFVVGVEA